MARKTQQMNIQQTPPQCRFEEAVEAFARVSELLARAEARKAAAHAAEPAPVGRPAGRPRTRPTGIAR